MHDGPESGAHAISNGAGTLAAVFAAADEAKSVIAALHAAGFSKTWLGVNPEPSEETRVYNQATGKYYDPSVPPGEHLVQAAPDGVVATLARFFGDTTLHSLQEALTQQGIPAAEALALDRRMHDGGAAVSVQVSEGYDAALAIMRGGGGDVAGSGPRA